MSIFDLHSQVLADYRDFVRSFFTIADDRTREFVDQALDEEARLWPDPLLQVSPSYARSATVDELAGSGLILEETARIFRTPEGQPFHLYPLVSRKKCTNPCSCETIVCTIPVASAAWCDRQA